MKVKKGQYITYKNIGYKAGDELPKEYKEIKLNKEVKNGLSKK